MTPCMLVALVVTIALMAVELMLVYIYFERRCDKLEKQNAELKEMIERPPSYDFVTNFWDKEIK